MRERQGKEIQAFKKNSDSSRAKPPSLLPQAQLPTGFDLGRCRRHPFPEGVWGASLRRAGGGGWGRCLYCGEAPMLGSPAASAALFVPVSVSLGFIASRFDP